MAGETALTWEKEIVPDDDLLFMRAHKSYVIDGELIPGVFRDHNSGMSTDWTKYSTPEQTRARARKPADNGVIQLAAGGIRRIDALSVEHAPFQENRAHTNVLGEKTPEARVKFSRIVAWAIPIAEASL